jgi:hypothetical protein
MLGLEASRDFSFGYREKAVTTRAIEIVPGIASAKKADLMLYSKMLSATSKLF